MRSKKLKDKKTARQKKGAISDTVYKNLVKHSPYGLVLIDSSGRWLFTNPAFTEITGYTLKDIPNGKAWLEKAFPDEEKRKEIIALWKKDYEERIVKEREFEITCKNGEKKWLGMRSIFLPDGQTIVALHDITERKALEEAKEKSESYYRALLEAIPDMVVITDPSGLITYVSDSATKFLGYNSPDEILGKNNQDFFAPEDLEKVQQLGSFIQTHGFLSQQVATVVRKDGKRRIVEISSAMVPSPQGQPSAYIAILRDITDRIQLENDLRQMLKEKEILIQEIHHRVKNNLQLVHSLLRLQYYKSTNPEVQAALKDTQSRVRAIALIYESLLRADRLDRINLKIYLDKIVSHLAAIYHKKEKNIEILLDLEEIYLDISRAHPCGLIVSELVSNSLKYAFANREKGTITVSLHKNDEGKIVLSVRDDGSGLPPDFDFKTSDSLGSQIVSDLVKQLNGPIVINSDQGTEITIIFSA